MAVALRGSTQMTAQASTVDVSWPASTAAGDLAVVVTDGHSSLRSQGWTSYTEGVLCKIVTAADIADDLTVDDTLAGLSTYTGARGIGQTRYRTGRAGLTLSEAGAGLFVHGWSPKWDGDIDPDTGRLGNKVDHEHYTNAVWFKAATTATYTSLSGVDGDATYVAYEILPSMGPSAPTVTTPAAGAYVDAAADIDLGWVHNSNSGSPQEQVTVRLTKVSDSSVVYLLADGTVSATPTDLTTSAQSATIDAGQLTSGQAYTLEIRTFDNSSWSSYSTARTFTPLARPTVDSITVTCPAEDRSPLIAWTVTAGIGAQSAWQVRVCASADADPTNPIFDSGVTAGSALSVTAPADTEWTNGAPLYAWVRVKDGAQWSAWTRDDATFAVDWTPPTAPTSVTGTDGAPMSVAIVHAADMDSLEVEFSEDGKLSWTALATVATPTTPTTVHHPLAKYGTATWFRARVWDTVDTVEVPSAWTESAASVTSTDQGAYLVADDETDYLAVCVAEDGARELVQGVGVSYGMGGDYAMVDRSDTAGESGSTSFRVTTLAARTTLVDWLTTHDVFRLRWHPELDGLTVADQGATRMAPASPIGWQRIAQTAIQNRRVSLSWVEQ